MNGFIIKTMNPEAIDEVLAIETASFKHPWTRECFINELSVENAFQFVLQYFNYDRSPRIIAYLCFRRVLDELHLLKFAVNPLYRRKGLGIQLLGHCLDPKRHPGVRRAILDVRASNTAAIGLYKKLGFEPAGRRRGYYSDTGEDALLMGKIF